MADEPQKELSASCSDLVGGIADLSFFYYQFYIRCLRLCWLKCVAFFFKLCGSISSNIFSKSRSIQLSKSFLHKEYSPTMPIFHPEDTISQKKILFPINTENVDV
jgi:hypothetical protein